MVGALEASRTVDEGLTRLVGWLAPGIADAASVHRDPPAAPPLAAPPLAATGLAATASGSAAHRAEFILATGAETRLSLLLEFREPASRPYLDEDLAFLRDLADRAGVMLTGIRVREEEHRIALELQRALLPRETVRSASVTLAARYEAASEALEVGGDWYDTLELPDGRLGITVGDVVGHGLAAATAMGRFRVAMGALARYTTDPGALLSQLDQFAAGNDGADFATACYAVFDPATAQLRYASAGHPPILVVSGEGRTRWLMGGRSGPFNGTVNEARPEAVETLEPGALLVLYSDGLIERRREPITVGLERLEKAAAPLHGVPAAEACTRLLEALGVDERREDDVVVLCMRVPEPFRHDFPAHPGELHRLRGLLSDWAGTHQVPEAAVFALLLAVNEAAANAIEHAYQGRAPGRVDVTILPGPDGELLATVQDFGSWRTASEDSSHRGRGTGIMRQITNGFERRSTPAGTVVQFRLSSMGSTS